MSETTIHVGPGFAERGPRERAKDYARILEDMDDWSLPIEATHWLRDHIEHGSHILELGSGEGTERLAEWFKVTTIEHDEKFLRPQWTEWSSGPIRQVHAPLDLCADGRGDWYSVDALLANGIPHNRKDFAAVIVDGPPGNIGRWGFVERLDMFPHNVPILIDDIHRTAEREIAVTVANRLGETLSMHLLKDGRAFGVVGRI